MLRQNKYSCNQTTAYEANPFTVAANLITSVTLPSLKSLDDAYEVYPKEVWKWYFLYAYIKLIKSSSL